MNLENKTIGFAITGSFCTYKKIFPELKKLVETKANVIPIFSYTASSTNTRFGNHEQFLEDAYTITGNKPLLSITETEPIGPKSLLDLLVIAPCTGNTLSKLANAITDTPVLMAAKGHLRNAKPVLISVSTNDALSNNLKNIGTLLNTKNIYFVPFFQDDAIKKPYSMISDLSLLTKSCEMALDGIQIQPIIK